MFLIFYETGKHYWCLKNLIWIFQSLKLWNTLLPKRFCILSLNKLKCFSTKSLLSLQNLFPHDTSPHTNNFCCRDRLTRWLTYALWTERELEGIKASAGLEKMSHRIALKLCQETFSTRQLWWTEMMSASLGIRSSIDTAVSRNQIKRLSTQCISCSL